MSVRAAKDAKRVSVAGTFSQRPFSSTMPAGS